MTTVSMSWEVQEELGWLISSCNQGSRVVLHWMGPAHLADERKTVCYVILNLGERAHAHKWKVYAALIQMARQV